MSLPARGADADREASASDADCIFCAGSAILGAGVPVAGPAGFDEAGAGVAGAASRPTGSDPAVGLGIGGGLAAPFVAAASVDGGAAGGVPFSGFAAVVLLSDWSGLPASLPIRDWFFDIHFSTWPLLKRVFLVSGVPNLECPRVFHAFGSIVGPAGLLAPEFVPRHHHPRHRWFQRHLPNVAG